MAHQAEPLGKKRDWAKLDARHRRRGELITVVFSPDDEDLWCAPARTGRRGRPSLYSDALIEALLTVKLMLRLPLRAVEGFALGLRDLAGGQWRVPDYSTLSLRQRALQAALPPVQPGAHSVLLVDSTGLKVFGEGEWKTRQHGVGRRRTWRKVHLLVDRESGAVTAVELTDKDTADCLVLPALLPEDLAGATVLGDGAYHTKKLHIEVHGRGGTLCSPPKLGARRWGKHGTTHDHPAFVHRNGQLRLRNAMGHRPWKLKSGYSRRSYVEAVMHRFKSITGDRLASRTWDRQRVEVILRCRILNRIQAQGASAMS